MSQTDPHEPFAAPGDTEQPLRAVLEGVSSLTGVDFFRSVARQLTAALDVRLAFVAEVADEARTRARTLAFWKDEALAENFEYALAGTPCEHVIGNSVCYHPKNVQKLFPEDKGLARMGIESYIGIPVLGSRGAVVGHLAAMDVKPLEGRLSSKWILKVFAARVGAEIERRRAEAGLRESRQRYALATRAARVGVWDWDVGSGEFYLDPNVKEILGYRDDEIPNDLDAWSEYIHPDDRTRVMEEVERHLESADLEYVCEHRMLHKDGSIRWIAAKGTTIRDDDGRPLRLVGTDADITERKHAEEEREGLEAQLRQAQKLESLGVLAGGIAHDFNNLLMGILGNASLAAQELSAHSKVRRRIEGIETAALRAADLTRQLLAYAGKASFIVSAIDLNRSIRELAPLLETAVSKKAIFRYELTEDLPSIDGDASQVGQVVMNLLTNASDALEDEPGIITLSTGVIEVDAGYFAGSQTGDDLRGGTYVFVDVSDAGAGMDPETQRKIFDPFFTTKFLGRGLGLAAVLGIVRVHGGAIKVASRMGEGTTIRVLFPRGACETDEPIESVHVPEKLSGTGTILVVDDEETVRETARAMLESLGFDVIEAGDGVEAVEAMRSHAERIRAVLLDMTMPRLDGEKAFFALRGMNPEAPVILMSGYDEQDVTRRLAGRRLAGFLQKPFRASDLVERLRQVLG